MEETSLSTQIYQLRCQHRDLDIEIGELLERPYVDQLLLQRLKKKKLWLKDMIVRLESELIPDLDA